jgi:hypothetical protein
LEEDNLLPQKYLELGPRWVRIAAFFHKRTPESIGNRWRVLQRRDKKQQRDQQPSTDNDLFMDYPSGSDSGFDGSFDFEVLFWD